MAGQAGHRVHAAGMVGWDRRPGTRITRPRSGVRRWAGGGVLRGGVRKRRHACVANADPRHRPRGSDRPVDARDADHGSHLLPGGVLRDARPAVAGRPAAHRSRGCQRQGWLGGPRVRHRAAVVRSLRNDRPRRLDRRGVTVVDHRTGQREGRRDLRMGQEPDSRRHPRPRNGFPDSERAGRQRRQRHRAGPLRGAPVVCVATRAMATCSPAHPYRMQPALLRAPSPAPRLGEHTEQLPPRLPPRS